MKLSEHQEQLLVMNFARQHPEIASRIYAIPNGGMRNAIIAMKMKAEGQKKGMPDLCLPLPKKGFHGLYIELKTKTGRLSPEQKKVISQLNSDGFKAVVCFGHEEAIGEIKNYVGIE